MQVLAYLEMFAEMYKLHQHVQFNTKVLQVAPLPAAAAHGSSAAHQHNSNSSSMWQVQSVKLGLDGQPEQQLQQQVSLRAHSTVMTQMFECKVQQQCHLAAVI
jgi:hypothetical protein